MSFRPAGIALGFLLISVSGTQPTEHHNNAL